MDLFRVRYVDRKTLLKKKLNELVELHRKLDKDAHVDSMNRILVIHTGERYTFEEIEMDYSRVRQEIELTLTFL